MPDTAPALDPERRGALHAAKLAALVRASFDGVEGTPSGTPFGANLTSGDRGWYLSEVEPQRSLGWALAWARQQGLSSLDVLAADASGHLARRAGEFGSDVTVWRVDGDVVVPATSDAHPIPPPRPDGIGVLLAMLGDAGLDVVEEHGDVWGEILGLEVARVVRGSNGAPALEVGIGRNDREAFGMMHGAVPTADALGTVVESVRAHRQAGAPAHPLNKLAAERWLRRVLVDAPHHVGAAHLEIAQPIDPRPNVKDQSPAAAVGLALDGAPLVVVCTVGVDLDAVATAADIALRHGSLVGERPSVRLALPARDALPATRALVDDLVGSASIHIVDDEWRSYA